MIDSFGDLTKKIGGKLNLNSILGVNMMMILGTYRFCISNAAYQSLARTTEYKWEELRRLGSEPALPIHRDRNRNDNIRGSNLSPVQRRVAANNSYARTSRTGDSSNVDFW